MVWQFQFTIYQQSNMTKQEFIKQAWGETLFPILEMEMKRNGGNWYKEWKNSGQFYGNFLQEGLRVHLYREGIENLNGWFYPSELKGIEDNNGWNQIEEKGTPETSGTYMCISEEWDHEVKMFFNGSSFLRDGWFQEPTHWRTIVEIPKPLY